MKHWLKRISVLGNKLSNRFFDWYWSLSALPRKIMGWCLLICGLIGLVWGIYLVGLGIYSGVGWFTQTIAQSFHTGTCLESTDDSDLMALDYYSAHYRHRDFPLGELNKRRRVNFGRDFNDLNDLQLSAAQQLGIEPQENREALAALKHQMVELHETRYYKLDSMTQSQPYLVPDAADFLTALSQRWQAYHGTHSRFIVTSCTRTEADVKKLRRVNINSSKNSTHRYGTTIDITYNRFDRRGNAYDGKLKEDLARALFDMREAGYCYVKFERKQACFHITVRPK